MVTPIIIRLRQTSGPGEELKLVLQLEEQGKQLIEEAVSSATDVVKNALKYRDTFVTEIGPKKAFSDIGQALVSLIRTGAVGQRLAELKQARIQGDSFRFYLDVETGEEPDENLALLPWELLFDGAQRPFQRLDDTIVRTRSYGEIEDPNVEPINWPIRILIVIGVDDPNIESAQEVHKIEEALRPVNRLVDVEVLEQPNINELETKCRAFRPHVFHYIGHGGLSVDKTAYLLLKCAAGNDPWLASAIETSLQAWEWRPRLAFLNACRTSAKSAPSDQISAWGVSDAFHALAVPAVIAMQADIKGSLAGEFAGVVYERLASGESLEKAVAAGRIKLRDNTPGLDKNNKRDWAIPVLVVSFPPDKILPVKSKVTPAVEKDIKDCVKFQEVSILANCRPDRRKFIHGFYPIKSEPADKNLMIVRGGKDSGKTWITLWCLEGCALQDHDVRYVEVVSGTSPKWLRVLLQIQRGDKSKAVAQKYPLIYRPLDPRAFDNFNHDLSYRIANKTPPTWDGLPFADQELDLTDLDNLPDSMIQEIFKSFRTALVNAVRPNSSLIIVLDQFSFTKDSRIAEGHMEKFLIPFLFEFAASGDLKSDEPKREVKFVLVLSDEELKDIYPELKKLQPLWHEVPLEGIPKAEFGKVVHEFFRNLKSANRADLQKLAKSLDDNEPEYWIRRFSNTVRDPWQPSLLRNLLIALEFVQEKMNP